MGAPAGTRPLTPNCYLTDEKALVYVWDFVDDGCNIVIEDVATGEIMCVDATALNGWRFVDPEVRDG